MSAKYQCCSCEQKFEVLTSEDECPYCYSGNWIEGNIDDADTFEIYLDRLPLQTLTDELKAEILETAEYYFNKKSKQ